jgi:uncharacterized protein with NRDE domain
MCLIGLDWRPGTPQALMLLANRDEFFDRPTEPMHWWQDGGLLAGKDMREGGTWMGLTRAGKFAAITNVRGAAEKNPYAPSRGKLPLHYLQSEYSPRQFVAHLRTMAEGYNGFNLLLGDLKHDELWWFSNRPMEAARLLEPGVHTLSNASLNTPWPKTEQLKQGITRLKAGHVSGEWLNLLLDDTVATNDALPSTGVPLAWERALSAAFIRMPGYGTRCSTLVLATHSGAHVMEHTHLPEDKPHTPRPVEQVRSFEFDFQSAR